MTWPPPTASVPSAGGCAEAPVTDPGEAVIAPGFLDIHCHGAGGAAFSAGPEVAVGAAATLRAHGTAAVLASLVSAPVRVLERQMRSLVPLVAAGVLAGLHLEGPWLSSSPRCAGCGRRGPSSGSATPARTTRPPRQQTAGRWSRTPWPLRATTSAPAAALGLEAGRLLPGRRAPWQALDRAGRRVRHPAGDSTW